MKPPVITRSGSDIGAEAVRLRRFQQAYAGLIKTLPDGGPLGDVAAGGSDALAWVLGETPALSGCLEDALGCALETEIGLAKRAAWRLPRRRWWQFWRKD